MGGIVLKKVIVGSLLIFTLLQQCLLAADILADDPAMIGTGARTLGLGRAFVAIADDVNTVFYNPAGLGQIDRFQAMSMANSSLLLGELKYTTGAFVAPLGFGTFGMGVISKRIEDIPLLSADAVDSNGRPDPDQVAYGYYEENVSLLSYGIDIGTASQFMLLKNLSLGVTLKNFKKYGRGENELLDEASAQGYDLDLGMRSNLNEDVSVGLAMRNVLDHQQGGGGGSLVWKTGEKEGIMAVYTAGFGCKMYDDQLIVAADVDVFERGLRPSLGHAGVEWRIAKILALRFGWDQIEAPKTNKSKCMVDNIMPLGVGITYFGFSADYAYYPAYNIEGNATHFFSVSFLGFDKDEHGPVVSVAPSASVVPSAGAEIVPTAVPGEVIDLGSFPEQAVVYTGAIELQGRAAGYSSLEINGRAYPVQNGTVRASIPLTFGRNELTIKAGDRELERQVLRLPTREEMRARPELADALEYVLTLRDLATLYSPDQKLTRGQLAAWIMSAKGLRVPSELQDVFSPNDLLVQKGYMDENAGTDGELITRGKLAVTIVHLEGLQEALLNVPAEQKEAESIALLDGTEQFDGTAFEPRDEILSMHDAAKLLARTSVVQDKVKRLVVGFAVPYLEMTPSTVAAGDTLSLAVKLPADVAVKRVTVQFGSARPLVLQKLTERYYRGRVAVSKNRAPGYYPVQVVAVDMYGNVVVFRDHIRIRARDVRTDGAQTSVKAVFNASSVLVNVLPHMLVPGQPATISVGLLEGQKCDAVVLAVPGQRPVVFSPKDTSVFEAIYTWPSGLTAATSTGVFSFYASGVLQGTMEYRFLKGTPASMPIRTSAVGTVPVPAGVGTLLTRVVTQRQGTMLRIHAAAGFVEGADLITAVMMILPDGSRTALVKKAANVWTAEVFITPLKPGAYSVMFKAKDTQGKIITANKKITIDGGTVVPEQTSTAVTASAVKRTVVPAAAISDLSTQNMLMRTSVKPPVPNAVVPKKTSANTIIKATVTNNMALSAKKPMLPVTRAIVTGNSVELSKKTVTANGALSKKTVPLKSAHAAYVPDLAFNPPRLKKGQIVYASVVIPPQEQAAKVTLVLDGISNGLKKMNGEWQGSCRLPAASGMTNVKIYIKYTDGHVLEHIKIVNVE